jgi:hypothetical protein
MERFNTYLAACDRRLAVWEGRFGLAGAAILVAAILLAFAGFYASENFVPLGFGLNYARLSEAPFRFTDPDILQYRILTPLVGYALGLRGRLFPLLTHAAGLAFMAMLYGAARRRAWRPVEAAGLAAAMATSINILGEVHYPGMTDTVSYLCLLGALLTRRLWVFGLAIALALLNHESNAFALPWLAAFGWAAERTPARRAGGMTGIALALVAFACARACLRAHIASAVPLTPGYYLQWDHVWHTIRAGLPLLSLGVFEAYKLLWALPLLAAALQFRRARAEALGLALVFACALAQLAFAEDATRLMGLAFPAVLSGAVILRRHWGSDRFAPLLWGLLLANLLVPSVAVFLGGCIIPFYPLPVTMLVQILFGVPL